MTKTVNHIVIKHNKQVLKEYKSKPNWVGKVINEEFFKGFEFHHTNKR